MNRTSADTLRVLAINPGNTSTKLGLFAADGKDCEGAAEWAPSLIAEQTLAHADEELAAFKSIPEQVEYRLSAVSAFLDAYPGGLSAVVGRGGLLRPIPGGTYRTNETMLTDLREGYGGHHASNLGGLLAAAVARDFEVPSFVVDPVSVDELQDVARITGLPEIDRVSLWHALNCKAAARDAAGRLGRDLEEINLIIVHLGSGITVAAIRSGQAIDVNNAVAEGPFGPDRAGGLPATGLVDLATSGKYAAEELKRVLMGKGGLFAYLGTRDAREVEERARQGDRKAALLLDAMVYQIGKEIGAMAAVLSGKVDAIVLTGGIARSDYINEGIIGHAGWIAPVTILPGEDELRALALGALRVLMGVEDLKVYPGG